MFTVVGRYIARLLEAAVQRSEIRMKKDAARSSSADMLAKRQGWNMGCAAAQTSRRRIRRSIGRDGAQHYQAVGHYRYPA